MSQISQRARLTTAVLLVILVMLLNGCASGENAPVASPTTAVTEIATITAIPATDTVTPVDPATSYPIATEASSSTSYPIATEASSSTAYPTGKETAEPPQAFDGARAYEDIKYQVSLGPRTPESEAHAQQVDWMRAELEKSGWTVEVQEFNRLGHLGRNVIAKRGTGSPWTILGAHFDSRMQASNDPDPAKQTQPVPAANDGASGVAVLMELARVLPKEMQGEVWLAFFDLEDQGSLPGWDWILGSRALAESLTGQPDAVVIVDMIGDADLNIYKEKNSNKELTEEIWATAEKLGYAKQFIPQERWAMMDDHTPFLEKGIRAVDLIDFDYPYWHTTQDTADKVSAQSLHAVGDTLLHWLLNRHAK